MIQTFKNNYPGIYKGKSLACQFCLNRFKEQNPNESITENSAPRDSQIHAYVCPLNRDLVETLDIKNSDIDVVQFFKTIIQRRMESGDY